MASRVNVGSFSDEITVYYVSSQTVGDYGDSEKTYDTYTLFADVQQLNSNQKLRYGMDLINDSYQVTCRPPASGRPELVVIDSVNYQVISAERDKVNQFLKLIVSIER